MSAFRIAPQPLSYGLRNKPRPRAHKARERTERSIQYGLVDILRSRAAPGVLWMAIPNGELEDLAILMKELKGTARDSAYKLLRMGFRYGAADMLFVKDGKTLFLELKRPGKKPNEDQNDFAGSAIDAGAEYIWSDNLNEIIDLLTARGILLPDRRAA